MADVNRRWEDLNRSINNRQKELENALLRLGQFQHALSELLVWIERTDRTLDTLKPVFGDPQVIEVGFNIFFYCPLTLKQMFSNRLSLPS